MTTRQLIGLLMTTSDTVALIRREVEGAIASQRPLSDDEHEAIKALLLGIQSDAGVADSKRFENYERRTDRHFAVVA